MLTITDRQLQEIHAAMERRFPEEVCAQFLANRSELRDANSRVMLVERMQAAMKYAIDAGFKSIPHIVRLMYLAADAPHIHDHPLVDGYLRKPGATPEQRLDDLDAVMRCMLARM